MNWLWSYIMKKEGGRKWRGKGGREEVREGERERENRLNQLGCG